MAQINEFIKGFGVALLGGVFRFTVFIPQGMYEVLGRHHWNVIKSNPELQGGLYSSAIVTGEKLAARWGKFGFYWNFAAWIPAVFVPAPANIVFGVVDGLIAGYLAFATHLQAGYSPKYIDACKGSGAHEFQLPSGANESFFDAAARLNATPTDSFHMCKSFVQEWQYGVAISTIYGTIAFLNIVSCVHFCFRTYWHTHFQNESFWKALLRSAYAGCRTLAIILFASLYWILLVLFRFLPISVKSRIRFARRYVLKAGQELEERSEMQMRALTKKLSGKGEKNIYRGKGSADPTGLADFLTIYDMLISVVENLHYVDLVNLGLVSRSVREAVFPPDAYAQRMIHFKMYTCDRKGKRECWSCLNQICENCKFSRALKQTTPYFHLDTCRPCCTKCYFTTVQQPPNRLSANRPMDPRYCKCAPTTPTPNVFQRWIHGSAYYSDLQIALLFVTRLVCRECNRSDNARLLEKRLDRSMWELKETGESGKGRAGMDKCSKCEGGLGNGPRWWVCKLCNMECRSMLHRAWGSGKEGKSRGEEFVGERAV